MAHTSCKRVGNPEAARGEEWEGGVEAGGGHRTKLLLPPRLDRLRAAPLTHDGNRLARAARLAGAQQRARAQHASAPLRRSQQSNAERLLAVIHASHAGSALPAPPLSARHPLPCSHAVGQEET